MARDVGNPPTTDDGWVNRNKGWLAGETHLSRSQSQVHTIRHGRNHESLKAKPSLAESLKLIDDSEPWWTVTTMHGIADFARAGNSLSKAFWFCAITVSLATCFGQLGSMLYNFKKKPWDSSVREIRRDSLSMPTIIFCNSNRLRGSKVKKYNMSENLERFIYQHMPAQYAFNREYTDEQLSSMAVEYGKWRKQSGMSFKKVLQKMGHSCHDMFVAFDSTDGRLTGDELCTGQSKAVTVSEFFDTRYGRCWQITMSSELKIRDSGSGDGLFFILNAELDEYSPFLHDTYLDQGFRMKVSYSDLDPGVWISVPAGHHLWVKIRKHSYRTERHFFEMVKRNCIDSNQIDHSLFLRGYWRDGCVRNCIINQNFINMKCLVLKENKALNYSMCEPDFAFNYTLKNGLLSKKEDVSPEIYSVCQQNCVESCNYDTVEAESDIGVIPNPQQAKRAAEVLKQFNYNLTESEVTEYLTLVNVYFDSMLIKETYSYEQYTIDTLLANIGGQLGLFSGISVITILQARPRRALLYALNALYKCVQQALCRAAKTKRPFMFF